MKQTVERLKLSNILESEDTRSKLTQAGYRGQAPLIAFMFFQFVMPFIVFGGALLYLFVVTHFTWSPWMKLLAAVGAALFGFYLPDLFVSNAISKRQKSIMRGFPDALDLMLICVESGMAMSPHSRAWRRKSGRNRWNSPKSWVSRRPNSHTCPSAVRLSTISPRDAGIRA